MVVFALVLLLSAGSAAPATQQSTLQASDSYFLPELTFISLLEQANVPIEVPYQDIDE